MNLKMVFVVLSALALVALVVVLIQTEPVSDPLPKDDLQAEANGVSETSTWPIAYECADDVTLEVDFDTSGDSLLLVTPANEEISLSKQTAASGVQYENLDGNIVLHVRDDETFLEEMGQVNVSGCEPVFEDLSNQEGSLHNPLADTSWEWVETVYADETVTTPRRANTFILNFVDQQRMSALTDCNNMMGSYELDTDQTLRFSELASTMMYCEDSQEEEFAGALQATERWRIIDDQLVLSLEDEEGSIIFDATEVITR